MNISVTLLDSLYQGFPVGYLISWKNPKVKLKDGSLSEAKRILIDGQQRVTALMASLLGREVLTKDYDKVRIRIAFHPVEQKIEVSNPSIQKDAPWISDVAMVFALTTSLLALVQACAAKNPDTTQEDVFRRLESLKGIINNHVGPKPKPESLKCRFQDLRHTAVTRLLEAGIPYPVVASVMGWSAATAIRMAKRYGHIGSQALREAADVLGRTKIPTGYPKKSPKSVEVENVAVQ
jgi:hypothetical protein